MGKERTSNVRRRKTAGAGGSSSREKPAAVEDAPSETSQSVRGANRMPPSKSRGILYQLFSRYRSLEGWTPNVVTAFFLLLFVRCISAIVTGQ